MSDENDIGDGKARGFATFGWNAALRSVCDMLTGTAVLCFYMDPYTRCWTDMTRSELEQLWVQIRGHMDTALRLLPSEPQVGDEGGSLEAYREWRDQNELELAFDELELLGEANEVTPAFWTELVEAARLMNLGKREARCHSRLSASVP